MADATTAPNTPPTSAAPPSQDTSLPLLRAHPLLGREENMKLLFDKMLLGMPDATTQDWANSRARLDIRSERNAVAFDKAMDTILCHAVAALAISTQTGETENQAAAGPQLTAEGAEETANAVVATGNAALATSIGNLANALVPIIVGSSALALSPTQLAQAVLAAVTAASGAAANNAGGGSSKS